MVAFVVLNEGNEDLLPGAGVWAGEEEDFEPGSAAVY